jgi:hypothetical protein
MEQEYRHEVPADMLHTPLLDFVDLDKFKPRMNEYLAAEDEALVRNVDGPSGKTAKTTMETKGTRPEVTWLRRTEYLATEANRPKAMTFIPELKPKVKLETREDVIVAIEESFQYCPKLEEIRHPTKPNLRATAIYPIIPSSEMADTYIQCTFDADPAVTNVEGIGVVPLGEQYALMKTMGSDDDAFVWYYLPTEEDRYVYARDYDIQRLDRHSASHFVLSVPQEMEGNACYTPIEGHYTLKKRRAKTDQSRQRHSLKITRT